MEEKKSSLTSFEVKEEPVIKMAPRQINNTPLTAVPMGDGSWKVAVGKYILLDYPFKSYEAAVKGVSKHKIELIFNIASLCAGIQIENVLKQKEGHREENVKTNQEA